MAQCRDVYYYTSRFLKGDKDSSHYHIVVLDIHMSEDGLSKKGVVIVTTHSPDRERFYKQRGGDGSFVILDTDECNFLNHTSIIYAFVYEEDERFLSDTNKKGTVSESVLEKIKQAALNNKENKNRIKRLL